MLLLSVLLPGELVTCPSTDATPVRIPQDHFPANHSAGPRHFGPALVDLRGCPDLLGRIDLVVLTGNRLQVIDFKTSPQGSSHDDRPNHTNPVTKKRAGDGIRLFCVETRLGNTRSS